MQGWFQSCISSGVRDRYWRRPTQWSCSHLVQAWKLKAGTAARSAVKTDHSSCFYDLYSSLQTTRPIQLSLALEVCCVVYVPFSISPCCSVRPGDGGSGLGGWGRTLVCLRTAGWEKEPCVIYSESDNDLVVQNALSLGAPPVKYLWFIFIAADFIQETLLLVEKNVSSDMIAGKSPCVLSLSCP